MSEIFGPLTVQLYQPDLKDLNDKELATRLDQLFKTAEDIINKGVLTGTGIKLGLRYVNILDASENPFGERGMVVITARKDS